MALKTDLIAYWKLDETSGTRVDSHTNGLDLTDNNTVGYATGKIDNAADFVAANSEYLSRVDSALVSPSSAMSVSLWLYPGSVTGDNAFFVKGNYRPSWSWGYQLEGSEIKCFIASATDDIGVNHGTTSGLGLSTSNWYHVVVVYDGAGAANADRLKVYVNGINKTLSFTGTIAASLADSTDPLWIGGFSGLGRFFQGRIDETAFWSRAITSSEVSEIYNSGNGLAFSSWDTTSSGVILGWAGGIGFPMTGGIRG